MCSICTLPFSEKALERTLIRLESEWEEYRSTRDRNAKEYVIVPELRSKSIQPNC